ncbi:hypothetical protein FRB95_008707 [Tulasnella sp. JGI-2019a]|nr:hypothetical protein FRB95_008707 [Tulasnella sp. JGI-2019a]
MEPDSSTASHMTGVSNAFCYSSDPFVKQIALFAGTGGWVNVKFHDRTVGFVIAQGTLATDFYQLLGKFYLTLAAADEGRSLRDTVWQLAELIIKVLPAFPVQLSLK